MQDWKEYELFPPCDSPFDIMKILKDIKNDTTTTTTTTSTTGSTTTTTIPSRQQDKINRPEVSRSEVNRSFFTDYRSSWSTLLRGHQQEPIPVYDASVSTERYSTGLDAHSVTHWCIVEISPSGKQCISSAHVFDAYRKNFLPLSRLDLLILMYYNPDYCTTLLTRIISVRNNVSSYDTFSGMSNFPSHLASSIEIPRLHYAGVCSQVTSLSNILLLANYINATREEFEVCIGLDKVHLWRNDIASVPHFNNDSSYYYKENTMYGNRTTLLETRAPSRGELWERRVPLYERRSVLESNTDDATMMFGTGENVGTSVQQKMVEANRPATPYVEVPNTGRTERVTTNYTTTINIPSEEVPSCYAGRVAPSEMYRLPSARFGRYSSQESSELHTPRRVQELSSFYRIVDLVNQSLNTSSDRFWSEPTSLRPEVNYSHQYGSQNEATPHSFRQRANSDSYFVSKDVSKMVDKTLESVPSIDSTGRVSADINTTVTAGFPLLSHNAEMNLPSTHTASGNPYLLPTKMKTASAGQYEADSNRKSLDLYQLYLPSNGLKQTENTNSCMARKGTEAKTAATATSTGEAPAKGVDVTTLKLSPSDFFVSSADSFLKDKLTKTPMTAETVAITGQEVADRDRKRSDALYLSSTSLRKAFSADSYLKLKESNTPMMTKTIYSATEKAASSSIKSIDVATPYLLPSSFRKTSSSDSFLKPKEIKTYTVSEIVASEGKKGAYGNTERVDDSTLNGTEATSSFGSCLKPTESKTSVLANSCNGDSSTDIDLSLYFPSNISDSYAASTSWYSSSSSDDADKASALPGTNVPEAVCNNLSDFNYRNLFSIGTTSNIWKYDDNFANRYRQPIFGSARNNNRSLTDPMTFDARFPYNQEVLYCRFCKNNREQPSFYNSHVLKDEKGNVTCPILYNYVCSHCGATGNVAHTDSHCRKNPNRGYSAYKKNPW